MFEEEDDGGLTSLHHPFTAPSCDVESLEANPAAALSRAYDLVLNGYELGGGSIRIHDLAMQRAVLEILGLDLVNGIRPCMMNRPVSRCVHTQSKAKNPLLYKRVDICPRIAF